MSQVTLTNPVAEQFDQAKAFIDAAHADGLPYTMTGESIRRLENGDAVITKIEKGVMLPSRTEMPETFNPGFTPRTEATPSTSLVMSSELQAGGLGLRHRLGAKVNRGNAVYRTSTNQDGEHKTTVERKGNVHQLRRQKASAAITRLAMDRINTELGR